MDKLGSSGALQSVIYPNLFFWLETILQRNLETTRTFSTHNSLPGQPGHMESYPETKGMQVPGLSHTVQGRVEGVLEGPMTSKLRNLLSQGWGKNPI